VKVIGPDQWGQELHNLVHHNGVGILAQTTAEVRYNRVFANVSGIQVEGDTYVHHNLIYRNTGHGVLVDGARDVQLVNNTIYAPAGDAIRLENFADAVAIRNNIVYAESGYGLYVAADSQFGYTSDYNNLYATGGGRVAFQGKDFYDVYDWQVEAEVDLHSIGRTDPAPTLDDPKFVNLGADDFHLRSNSTSIDAGQPSTPFGLEPGPNGNRVNLGAYGNTPEAATSATSWLRIVEPNFYVDLVPSRTYEIRWETYNVPGTDTVDIDLLDSDGTKVCDVAAPFVSAGSVTWSPGDFVSGDPDLRYRIELSTSGTTSLTARSREAFSVPDVVPADPQTFYVNDKSQADDEYATAVGDNRNTGTRDYAPKEVIRPLVLSYALGSGDSVRVDTGSYVHAVNLNLSGSPMAFDPRMNTAAEALITGPTDLNRTAQIDRANPHPGSKTIDIIASDAMALKHLTLIGAYTGLHVRDDSDDFVGEHLTIDTHTADGLDIEGHSDEATLDYLAVHDNGHHGVFVESLLTRITESEVYDNEAIGMALRNVGDAIVETSRVYGNLTGIDIINPGAEQAVIGHPALDQDRGNLVYENDDDGIFASGNVLVAGNTVAENGDIGIYLNDGADAERNVVRQHTSGIWALGSESDIHENRSYANADTGIAASFDSRVQRNVTYTNGEHGIYVDWFSGVIDHNLFYDTGSHSIVVEGAAAGAALVNNTVYEPCADNVFAPPAGQTTIEIPWEWQIVVQQFPDPVTGDPGGLFPVALSGSAQIRFGTPVGDIPGATFDLGSGGGAHAQTAEPVPPGQVWTVETEIVALDLKSVSAPGLGEIWAMLQPGKSSAGSITVECVDAGLGESFLRGSSALALNVAFVLRAKGQVLLSTAPMSAGMTFDASSRLGPRDALRMAIPVVVPFGTAPVGLINPEMPLDPWGQWLLEEGREGPADQDRGHSCASAGIYVRNQSEYVLLRNNAVFVEGGEDVELDDIAHDVIVASDSRAGWHSDFNLLTTRYGAIGKWADATQMTLADWQSASADDYRSIDSDANTVWVDPDDADDRLGFISVGAADGRDDNVHLKSLHGQVQTGALAPVEQIAGPLPVALPTVQPVTWGNDLANLSPAIDWGDPAYLYDQEPAENGQMVNLGTYGNTAQASKSEPYYIHLVYPLGHEELVGGRTFAIQWRSRLPSEPTVNLTIELRHGDKDGSLELTIDANAPDAGSYSWAVPSSGITRAADYVVVIRWPGDPTDPNDDIVGTSRRHLTVDADGAVPDDTVPPAVVDVTPRIVQYAHATNDAAIDRLTVEFSERLDATAAGDSGNYELTETGDDGTAFDLTPTYTPGATDGDTSHVDLFLDGRLPPGEYRLRILATALVDEAGLSLDGDDDGTAGGDYVREFVVELTGPTVAITDVSPLQNGGLEEATIVFSEAVHGFGLADLRLTRDGGSNLLTGRQTLRSDDLVTWTLDNLEEITEAGGTYALDLAVADCGIVDLAGNPLAAGADENWSTDTTAPTVQIVPVTPDPRSLGVTDITIVFSEPVVGFDRADLMLRRDGGANLLTAANGLTSVDGISWTLSGLATLTDDEGLYTLTLVAEDSNIADQAGNALAGDALEVWELDALSPEADFVDVSPDPRHAMVERIRIEFNQPITGLDLGDLRLTRDGGPNLLTGAETLFTLNNMTWLLSDLSGVTGSAGVYQLLLAAAGSGIEDQAGNALLGDAVERWTVDQTPPAVTIAPVDPDPRTQPVDRLTIVFTEPAVGFDLSDLTLARDGGENLLTAAQRLSTSDGLTWTLENLLPLTAIRGDYVLSLVAGSDIADGAGNALVGSAAEAWRQDSLPPHVDLVEVAPDPHLQPVSRIDIVFTEPVTGLDLADLLFFRNDVLLTLAGTAILSTVDQTTWTLDNLSDLTCSPGEYGLVLGAPGSDIADLSGNPLPSGGTETWEMVNVWHNATNPWDVDGKGTVIPLDVLIIINYINSHPGSASLPAPPQMPPPYYDVNNDGRCTPLDVLLVINHINNQPLGSGAGEAFPARTAALVEPSPRRSARTTTAWDIQDAALLAVLAEWSGTELDFTVHRIQQRHPG
jgi:hypothetical protein